MVTLANIVKTFNVRNGTLPVLRDVSLEIAGGEFVAVQGPSGSGKTTLLLTAGALQRPDSGEVIIGGEAPYEMSADERAAFRARAIGFVFQQFHLLPYLNVIDNILTPTLVARSPEMEQRAGELLERFGLAERREHVPAALSIGERQRAALARAMVHQPTLLLADEPTGNLDRVNAEIVLDSLKGYAAEGHCVLMVTHNEAHAGRADRELHLRSGALSAAGPAATSRVR